MTTAAILNILVNADTGKASANLQRFNGQLKATESQANRSTGVIGGKMAKAVKVLGVAAAAGAAYGLYKAVSAGAEFERQIDSLGSVAQASGRQIKAFEKQALKLGESTAFTANEVARAQTELAKGGLTVKQILGGGTKAALSLAAAGQLDLAQAAEVTVNAMKLFSLQAKDAERVADTLATAANKTTGDVQDFALALRQGGGVAKLAGMDFNETVTVLEALAEAGYKGSDAGTSLKSFFINIGTPSEKAKKAMESLGLSIFNAQGELKKLPALSKNLREAFGDVSEEEFLEKGGIIAGSDAIRSLYALYDAGPKKLRAFEKANLRQGTAAKVAAEKMDNLQGDFEQFTGALETGYIKLYQVIKGPLRSLTQWATGAVQDIINFDYSHAIAEIEAFGQKVADVYQDVRDATSVKLFGKEFSVLDVLGPTPEKAKAEVEGVKSVFSNLPSIFGAVKTAIGAVKTGWEAFIGGVQKGVDWIDRAANNVAGFVTSLIPVKIAAAIAATQIRLLIGAVKFAFSVFNVFKPQLVAVANVIRTVFSVALSVARTVIQTFLKTVGNIVTVLADIVGVVSNLLRGKWGAAWRDAKQLVVDAYHTIIDVWKGGWTTLKALFSGGVKILKSVVSNAFSAIKDTFSNAADFLGNAFSSTWDKIEGIFVGGANAVIDVINLIIKAINLIPGVPDIDPIGHIGTGGVSNKKLSQDPNGASLGRQRGGPVPKWLALGGLASLVPGSSTGDRHILSLNGSPIAKVESKEGIFVGNRNLMGALQLANDAVPRFQKGGLRGFISGGDVLGAAADVVTAPVRVPAEAVGDIVDKGADFFIDKLPTPDIPEPLRGLGPYLIDQVTDWIKNGFETKKLGKFTSSLSGISGYKGPPANMKQLGDAAWVDSHTLAVISYIAKKFGLTVNSTYRTPAHNEAVGGVENSDHTHGSPANPGAADFSPPSSAALAWATSHIAGLDEALIHDAGSGLHLHLGFFQRGGLLQQLAEGGFVEASSTQKNVALHVARNLLGRGLNYKGASGVVGNAWRESRWTPSSIGSGGRGFWGFDFYEAQLLSEAEAKGIPWTDIDFQTDFMWSGPAPASALKGGLNSQASAAAAAKFFDSEWEKSGIKAMSERMDGAREVMRLLGQVDAPLSGEKSDEHTFKEDVPAVWNGLRTDSLNFGSIPKSLEGINKELGQRRRERSRYRKGVDAANSKKRPGVAQALQHNVTALEGRIRELERAQVKARVEKVTKKFRGKLGEQLGKLTGFAKPISEAERGFNAQQQYAEQVVDLEPIEPTPPPLEVPPIPSLDGLDKAGREKAKERWEKETREAERAYGKRREGEERSFAQRFADYVSGREGSAYGNLLGKAATWRNVILQAQRFAAGPWDKAKTLGGLEGHWEDKIISTAAEIKQAEDLVERAPEKLQSYISQYADNHKGQKPKPKDYPDWLTKLLAAADKAKNEQLPILRSADRELRKALGEGQAEFYPGKSRIRERPTPPLAGTGQLEEALEKVQGIHWPEQHEVLKKLPSTAIDGKFGGVIWDVQNTIGELGLKVSGAFEGVSSGSVEWPEEEGEETTAPAGKTPREEQLEELLRQANLSKLIYERQAPVLERFAGFHAKGGFIPSNMWGIAGEAGPEIVHGPSRIFSNTASASMASAAAAPAGPHVEVHNYRDGSEVWIDGVREIAADVYDHKSRQGGRGAKTIGARIAGRQI